MNNESQTTRTTGTTFWGAKIRSFGKTQKNLLFLSLICTFAVEGCDTAHARPLMHALMALAEQRHETSHFSNNKRNNLAQIYVITDPTPAPPLHGRGAATAILGAGDFAGTPLPLGLE